MTRGAAWAVPAISHAVLLLGALGCGAPQATASHSAAATPAERGDGARAEIAGHPPLALVTREGDGRAALAVAVTTEGLAPDRGAMPAVALAALVEARLRARGLDVTATGGWSGWRLRVLLGSPPDLRGVVDAVRSAMLSPVTADDPALARVQSRSEALLHRPLADPSLGDFASCTGEAFSIPGDTTPTAAQVEGWRARAHGLGRVAMAIAGGRAACDAATSALSSSAAWPAASPVEPAPWKTPETAPVVYDASGDIPPGSARIIVTARTPDPERAVAAARDLDAARGALASRLGALEAPAHVDSIAATAHVDGGCLAATVDLAGTDAASDQAVRVATAAALARQEIAVEVADAITPPGLAASLATRAPDPRDAAERAAWWTLAGRARGAAPGDLRLELTVALAAPKDAALDAHGTARDGAIRSAIDRATLAWHAPVVEERALVEPGQGDLWLLLASPCGTLSESAGDAGMGAEVAITAASQVTDGAHDIAAEAFVAPDGIGVLVHGPARPGERPEAYARRLADGAARAFAADALDPRLTAQARTTLLLRESRAGARSLALLGAGLAPGHPSWVAPFGTSDGLSAASDRALALRAAALRSGPLRVAILANTDAAQADAAARSVDRWIARRPGEARACPPEPGAATPRAGTYAVDALAGAPSEALLAFPFVADAASTAAASWVAAALDGPDGLLARALGGAGTDAGAAPLARAWSATVLRHGHPEALVVRIDAADGSLDGAVAQARALFDRLRQGALTEKDHARASARIGEQRLAESLDPRERAIALWRGEAPVADPSLEAMRSFAASCMRDEALVVVASRPPRPETAPRAVPDTKGRRR
jgi:hypothetical protein